MPVCQLAYTKLKQLDIWSKGQLGASRLADYLTMGTLNNDGDDGIENITKKRNLRPFKLYRVYLDPLNSSNVGDFSWSWILKGFIHVEIEKGKFVVVCPRPPYNVAVGGFTS